VQAWLAMRWGLRGAPLGTPNDPWELFGQGSVSTHSVLWVRGDIAGALLTRTPQEVKAELHLCMFKGGGGEGGLEGGTGTAAAAQVGRACLFTQCITGSSMRSPHRGNRAY